MLSLFIDGKVFSSLVVLLRLVSTQGAFMKDTKSEFLRKLGHAAQVLKANPVGRDKMESALRVAGLPILRNDKTNELCTNPITQAVQTSVFNEPNHFTLMSLAERAWGYYQGLTS